MCCTTATGTVGLGRACSSTLSASGTPVEQPMTRTRGATAAGAAARTRTGAGAGAWGATATGREGSTARAVEAAPLDRGTRALLRGIGEPRTWSIERPTLPTLAGLVT